MDSDNSDFDSANDVGGTGDTLRPMEALDPDDVRNVDGDEVVDPPRDWSEADKSDSEPRAEDGGGESLDDKLAAEEPDRVRQPGSEDTGDAELLPDDQVDHVRPDDYGRDEGQVSGSPEDGDPIFPVVE